MKNKPFMWMKKGDKCIYFTFDTMQRQISLIEQLKLIFYVKPNLILIVPSKTHTQMATQTYRKTEKNRDMDQKEKKRKRKSGKLVKNNQPGPRKLPQPRTFSSVLRCQVQRVRRVMQHITLIGLRLSV